MSIDVFGRLLVGQKEIFKGPPGVGFELTREGDFDIQNKKLCNIANAEDEKDAVNLKGLRDSIDSLRKDISWKLLLLEEKVDRLELFSKYVIEGKYSFETNKANLLETLASSDSQST